MPNALLLGKPLHHQLWPAPGRPERLVINLGDGKEKMHSLGFGFMSVSRGNGLQVVYYKQRLGVGPDDALVYARLNYEPQEDDIAKVYQTFGGEGRGNAPEYR